MIKIKQAFENKKAFISFITAGDPDLETTEKLIYEIEKSGADLIEIGIPFSDPIAEGIVIQEADIRALENGTTTEKIFELIERIRPNVHIPLVFMTYINVIFGYGSEKFISRSKEIGIDGLIVPDMPYEEKDELLPYCKKYDIELVSLVAPTSHDRISKIAKDAEGFIYIVSSLGVTGVRSEIRTDINEMVSLIKSVSDIPCAVGFGISTPEQAATMCETADGAIVGSAIVKIIEKYGKNSVPYVSEYVKAMSDACHKIKCKLSSES